MFFQLLNHCKYVPSTDGGAIYDLEARNVVECTPEEGEWLQKALAGEEILETDFFQTLEDKNLGFQSEYPYYLDALDAVAASDRLFTEADSIRIQAATLQLTGRCDSDYDNCGEYFCPPCKKETCAGQTEDLPVEGWKTIIDALCLAGTSSFILTGGNVLLYQGLDEIVGYLKEKGTKVSIVLRTLDQVHPSLLKERILLFPCASSPEGRKKYRNVTVYCHECADRDMVEKWRKDGYPIRQVRLTEKPIKKASMVPCDLSRYQVRNTSDPCLKGKLYVDFKGNLIPCLQGSSLTVGNLLRESFWTVYKRLIETYWNTPIQRDSKCRDCRWFYSCPSCRFTNVNLQCRVKEEVRESETNG